MERSSVLRQVAEMLFVFSAKGTRHRSFKRRVALWFILAAAVTIGLSVASYVNVLRAAENVRWVEHTHAVLHRLRAVSAMLDESSRDLRDRTLTRDDHFLEQYRRLVPAIHAELGAIRQLTADNGLQQRVLTDLETLVTNRLSTVEQALNGPAPPGIDTLVRLDTVQGGEMDRIRQAIAEMTAVERRLLVLRSQAAAVDGKATLAFFVVGTIANIVILVLVFLSISREIGRRNVTEQELRQSEQRFESSFEAATVGNALVDINGKWLEVNHSFCEIVGFSKEELFASNSRRLDQKSALDDLLVCAREVRERGLSSYQVEKRYTHRSGKVSWITLNISLIRDGAGHPLQFLIVIDDVTARKRAEEEIYRERQRYLGLVEATGSIVWNTLPSGEVGSEQPAWSAFSGQSADEVKGSGWLDALHPDDRSVTTRTWSVALAAKSSYQVEHRVRGRDGVYRYMLARAVPIRAADGTIEEWVGVHSDIDDQKRSHIEMCQAKEAAEAASQAKGEFLANVSHEIRTPMNAILGMTELTLETELAPDQRDNLQIVRSAAESLLTVINDLLDFSKIDAGKLELDPLEFDLGANLDELLGMVRLRAFEKGLELACRVGPEVPDQLIGDPVRLRQILVNLVTNAIKFTERGEVVIDVGAEPATDGRVTLHFRVIDTGIGIPADKQEAIFAPFTQADGSTTRLYGGTGLGLAISSQLAKMMEGRVWVESEVGQGSTFHFTAQVILSKRPPATEDACLVSLQGVRVLVVDDIAVNRRILHEILTYWGIKPTLADSGQAALSCLALARDAGTPFSMVLLDAMMPEMDGFTLAERINADPTLGVAVLLMLTSVDRQRCAGRLQTVTIAACLQKPVRRVELKAAILKVLGQKLRAAERPSPGGPPASPPVAKPLRILMAEDNPFNQRVGSLMLAKSGHAVTIAGNGREAIAALAGQSFDLVLMDLQMPLMDGFEATAAIRTAEQVTGRHIPIIALTAHAMKEDRDRCLEAGMDGYVSKPIQQDKLRQAIEDCILLIRETVPEEPPDGAQGNPIPGVCREPVECVS
jgi:two-component system sensor histidine kinase/response regulator